MDKMLVVITADAEVIPASQVNAEQDDQEGNDK
jgi:hypothetical protein